MKMIQRIIAAVVLVLVSIACAGPTSPPDADQDKSADDLIAQAELALRQKRFREAADLATKAIERDPDRPNAFVVRGLAHSELDEHAKALADFDQAVKLNPTARGAHRQRGRELFKMGEVEKSIAAFDRFVELEPEHENGLWERGLSRYYAGQFRQAQKSFEDYHKVGADDTENDLWRMLSQAEVDGLAEGQKVLKTLHARRGGIFPPMYDLYTGKIKPDEAFSRATDGATNDNERRTEKFYAHLYVGMWYVATRDKPKAIDHLETAVALRSNDYMWHVARLQLERLKVARESK